MRADSGVAIIGEFMLWTPTLITLPCSLARAGNYDIFHGQYISNMVLGLKFHSIQFSKLTILVLSGSLQPFCEVAHKVKEEVSIKNTDDLVTDLHK